MQTRTFQTIACAISFTLLCTGCPCGGAGVPATLSPFIESIGYTVEGEWDFAGTLTYSSEAQAWFLDGSFTFPSSGYHLAEPDVQIAESFPEQVFIRFTVTTPPPYGIVNPVIIEVPVAIEIAVSSEAAFNIRFVRSCF